MPQLVTLVIPEAPSPVATAQVQERSVAKGGIRLGILDNTKSNADHLLRLIVDGVKAKMTVASVVSVRKDNASTPASKELIDQLEKEADYVISGMGD